MFLGASVYPGSISGFWWAAMPKEQWPEDEESQAIITQNWDDRFGDRFQQLIFIGKPEILVDIRRSLEKSLFTEEELRQGLEYIQQLSDPFGDWNQMIQEQAQEQVAENNEEVV